MGFLIPSRSRAQRLGLIAPLIAVAMLGAVHLEAPLGPQQAHLLAAASAPWLADSAQPGLLLFYYAATRLFGFSEISVHFLELICLLAMTGFIAVTLTRHLHHRWIALLSPLATAGVYYLLVPLPGLTRAGILACFPLYVSLWSATAYWSTPRARTAGFLLSGLSAAVAALFHPILAGIPILFWIVSAVFSHRRHRNRASCILVQRLLPALAGILIPLGAAGYLQSPRLIPMPAIGGAPDLDLRIALSSIPWMLFCAVAFIRLRERIWPHPFWLMITVWAAAAMALSIAIGQEDLSAVWLAVVPLGIVALAGLDEALLLLEHRGFTTRFAAAVILPAALLAPGPALSVWILKTRTVPEPVLRLDRSESVRYRTASSSGYEYAWRDTRFLTRPGTTRGTILVCGGPFHFLVLRDMIPGRVAWLDPLPASHSRAPWSHLRENLHRQAPSYLFLDQASRARFLRDSSPDRVWFTERYELVQQSSAGAWYQPIASAGGLSRVF